MSAPKVGIWRAVFGLGNHKAKRLVWPEGAPAVVLGVVGGALLAHGTSVAERVGVVGDVLALAGAMLAVVFTALAIVVSLPSSRYLRELSKATNGIQAFLDPFLVAAGTQIAVIVIALGYKLGASHLPHKVEHATFYVMGFLVVYGLLDVGGLARSLVRHGILRSLAAVAEDVEDEEGADVRRLPERGQR